MVAGDGRDRRTRDRFTTNGEAEVPHHPGALGSADGVVDAGAEREAGDDPEHSHDCADQRRPHRHRSPSPTGLDGETRAEHQRG